VRYVTDPEVARRLPSRFAVPLFRTIAYVRLTRLRTFTPGSEQVMLLDRHQSTWEVYLVGAFIFATTAVHSAELLARGVSFPVAILIAPFLASIGLQVLIVAVGLLITPLIRSLRDSTRLDINSALSLSLHLITSMFMLRGWMASRVCAISTIVFYAVNAVAWIANQMLKERVQKLENRFIQEGQPSGA
jgi:hypothetical protein